MRDFGRFALILLLVVNSGCAFIASRSDDAHQKVELLIEAQNFGQAQAILALVSESHPDYQRLSALQQESETLAAQYEQQVMREGWVLKEEGKWFQAQEHYRQGLANLPHSETLRNAMETLNLRRENRVAVLELDMLVSRGEWLAQNRVINDELALLTPSSWFSKSRYEEQQKEALKVAQKLSEQGAAALLRGELDRAEQVLSLSDRLNASEQVKAQLATIDEQRSAEKLRAQKREQQLEDKRQKFARMVMLGSFKNALNKNRLNQATLIARQLKQQGNVTAEGQQLIARLDRAVQQQIDKDLEVGVDHYGKGDYQQAIAAWQNVLELESGNQQALEHIARAERILGNLQRLREEKGQ